VNKKIIMAVLAGGRKPNHPTKYPYLRNDPLHYEKMEQAARETCFKDIPKNISTYYIYNRDGRVGIDIDLEDGESVLIDDRFYFGVDDPGHGREFIRRCIEFFGYCLKNFEFDYIFRPNIGCWVDFNGLNRIVNSLPKTRVWAGETMLCRHTLPFAAGSGIIFSKDVIELLWDAHVTSEYGDVDNDFYKKCREVTDLDLPSIFYDNWFRPEDAAFACFFGNFKYHPFNQLGINVPLRHIPTTHVHEKDITFKNIAANSENYLYYFSHPKSPDCYYKMRSVMEQINSITDYQI
jgi:hypothetical protein